MDKLWTNVALFHWTNNAELGKKIDIVLKPIACNGGSALGALGRRFESFRPD